MMKRIRIENTPPLVQVASGIEDSVKAGAAKMLPQAASSAKFSPAKPGKNGSCPLPPPIRRPTTPTHSQPAFSGRIWLASKGRLASTSYRNGDPPGVRSIRHGSVPAAGVKATASALAKPVLLPRTVMLAGSPARNGFCAKRYHWLPLFC